MAIVVSEACDALVTEPACATPLIDLLKAVVSISTAATATLMIWQLRATARRNATKTALSDRETRFRARNDAQTPAGNAATNAATSGANRAAADSRTRCLRELRLAVLRRASSVLFLLANCVHATPGFSRTFRVEMLGMMVPYRFEPLVTVWTPRPTHLTLPTYLAPITRSTPPS